MNALRHPCTLAVLLLVGGPGCDRSVPLSRRDCDITNEMAELDWDTPLPWTGEVPRELVARHSGKRFEISWPRDQVRAHPWLHDVRHWTLELTPHPKRRPVQVEPTEGSCPEMINLPLAVRLVGGNGRILLQQSGHHDDRDWAQDPGWLDLPWRHLTSALWVRSDEVVLSVRVEPGPSDEAAWSPAVDATLYDLTREAGEALGPIDSPRLVILYGDMGQGAASGMVMWTFQRMEEFEYGHQFAFGAALGGL